MEIRREDVSLFFSCFVAINVPHKIMCLFCNRLKVQTRNIGLQGQWFEIWFPRSNHEAAFIFEDDMEVDFLRSLIEPFYIS